MRTDLDVGDGLQAPYIEPSVGERPCIGPNASLVAQVSLQLVPELAAVLGAAYESFLKARLERRAGRRGKVHARSAKRFIEMVAEIISEAAGGQRADELWQRVIAELDRDRVEIEADVLTHHGSIVVEHEWAAFLAWLKAELSTSLVEPSK